MNPLELLQRFVHGRLASDDYFSNVGIYLMRPRVDKNGVEIKLPHIIDQIETALSGRRMKAGKAGAAVTVEMPYVKVPNADAQTLMEVAIVVRCLESPTINMSSGGTGKSCEEIGLAVMRVLNGFVPHGVSNQLYCAPEAMVFNEDYLPRLAYDVTMATKLQIDEERRVARPVFSVVGDAPAAEVTITCGTADAVIYYTLNESYPSAANASAQLYEGPFTVTEPGSIFAAAYLDGRGGSNVAFVAVAGEEAPDAEGLTGEDGAILYSEDGSVLLPES